MTRARFFAALAGLAGVAKAQQWRQCVPDAETLRRNDTFACSNKMKSALNNQCPVCGEMAEPLKPHKMGVTQCKPVPGTENALTCEPLMQDPDSPQLTRCKRCNAAFWRDYEVRP